MKHFFISILVAFCIAFFGCFPALAEEAAPDPSFKYNHNYASYKINEDGSSEKIIDYAFTVLKESALSGSRTQTISYSTSVEKADIIKAYTQKKDGKKLEVSKSNFQLEVNGGKDGAAAAFSDRTSLTVVFPDVAVGDSVYLSYKITQKEPIFPSYFSEFDTFNKGLIWDDVKVKFDYPASMKARYDAPMMTEVQNKEDKGRKIIEWSFQNKTPVKDKRNGSTVYEFGMDPSYIISNFPSYKEIAEAYGVRSNKKAAVTERVQKLADEITKGKTDPREQAKLLYEYVSNNISYAGNCIGVGTVVPRDTDFVIDNRMGDCKDHATLLQALLAAKKITSTQALIGVGNFYKLYDVPIVSLVNHVINYIPSLDMYLDATAKDIPFGMLPQGEAGKPVLLVDNFKEGTKTPVISYKDNKFAIKTKIKIGEDGGAKGNSEIYVKGYEAVSINAMLKHLTKAQEEDAMKGLVKSFGFEGTAKLTKEDKPENPDETKLSISFDVKGFINVGATGALEIPEFSIYNTINQYKVAEETPYANMCIGGGIREEFTYEFPKNVKILAIPDNLSFKNEAGIYNATYSLAGETVNVVREYEEPLDSLVCDQAINKLYKQLADKVMPNLKSQIVYK